MIHLPVIVFCQILSNHANCIRAATLFLTGNGETRSPVILDRWVFRGVALPSLPFHEREELFFAICWIGVFVRMHSLMKR